MEYLWLISGLAFLYLGGEYLVKGCVGVALKLKVSALVIGLTVMAFATSAPELIVSLQAAIDGHPDLALGNVFGSNIANIGLILALVALLYQLPVTPGMYKFDWVVMMAVTFLIYLLMYFERKLGLWGGALLVTLLIFYTTYKIRKSQSEVRIQEEINTELLHQPIWKILFFLFLGIIGLRYGASFFVQGASTIALNLGVSERVISVSVVAVGTSIPELVASIIAARKNEKDMAIGNIIGSNIFNILGVLGLTALIKPIFIQDQALITFDYWWMLGFAFILMPITLLGTRGNINRVEGGILLLIYTAYIFISFY
jgi:cation:H+ antiporter